jgi:4'-phosphopantetheinyl transferase
MGFYNLMSINLKPFEMHVWSGSLALTEKQAAESFYLLSKDEQERAWRLRVPLARQQFIASRSMLRQILSQYLDHPPQTLGFSYTKHGKPYLQTTYSTHLQFNLTHSHEKALIAVGLNCRVGIDLEYVPVTTSNGDKQGVAERFFNIEEKQTLQQLLPADRPTYFYRIWSRKEAVIKAIGKGLSIPLASFSVAAINKTIVLEEQPWTVIDLANDLIDDHAYQAALASDQKIEKMTYKRFKSVFC